MYANHIKEIIKLKNILIKDISETDNLEDQISMWCYYKVRTNRLLRNHLIELENESLIDKSTTSIKSIYTPNAEQFTELTTHIFRVIFEDKIARNKVIEILRSDVWVDYSLKDEVSSMIDFEIEKQSAKGIDTYSKNTTRNVPIYKSVSVSFRLFYLTYFLYTLKYLEWIYSVNNTLFSILLLLLFSFFQIKIIFINKAIRTNKKRLKKREKSPMIALKNEKSIYLKTFNFCLLNN